MFRLKLPGSQIESSHACFLDPSSDKLGVEGRSDCLMSVNSVEKG